MATAFKIEKGVPAPTRAVTKYPFGEMGVGDSFFIATDSPTEHAVRQASHTYGRRNNLRFTCRAVDGGLRIWRTA